MRPSEVFEWPLAAAPALSTLPAREMNGKRIRPERGESYTVRRLAVASFARAEKSKPRSSPQRRRERREHDRVRLKTYHRGHRVGTENTEEKQVGAPSAALGRSSARPPKKRKTMNVQSSNWNTIGWFNVSQKNGTAGKSRCGLLSRLRRGGSRRRVRWSTGRVCRPRRTA
jgi:hypothetical protein